MSFNLMKWIFRLECLAGLYMCVHDINVRVYVCGGGCGVGVDWGQGLGGK